MIIRRSIAFGILAAALAVGCGRQGAGSALRRVEQAGVLRWGADLQGGEPYCFEDPLHPGVLVGFEVDIAKALARELGVRQELVHNDWSTLVPSLERGTFDIAMNGIEVTPARSRRISFTHAYYTFAEQLVARVGDARITGLYTLRGRRVGTLGGSLAWDMLEATGAERVPYEGVDEPFIDLLQRRTDAVLLDDIIVDRYGHKPGLAVVGNVGVGRYAIGVRKTDGDLLRAVDDALSRIFRSGELARILARWKLHGVTQAAGVAPFDAAPEAAPHAAWTLSPRQLQLFLQAAANTLIISTGAMLLAISWGLCLAVARLPSPLRSRRLLAAAATAYVEIFRGTPVLLQLYVLYYGLADILSLDAFGAAMLGLGLNYAAYEAEIYRAGIQAVPAGEVDAAHALGMSHGLALRRVILPQAFRFSLPGIANDFIALLKDSSLVSVITVVELTKRMTIAAVDGRGWMLPGLLCAMFYLAMSYPLSVLARRLEIRLGGRA